MKLLEKITSIFILISTFLIIVGCQEVVYDNILKEVSLEDSTVAGSIRSIVRFDCGGKQYLYVSNGGSIFRKDLTLAQVYGCWQNLSPSGINSGNYILQLAADSKYLYALVGTWEENFEKGQNRWNSRGLYFSSDGATWTLLNDFFTSTGISAESVGIPANIFCTNSINKNNRHAYLNYVYKVYKMDGNSLKEQDYGVDNAARKPTTDSVSCVALGSDIYFFNRNSYCTTASCTNETTTKDGTIFYYSNGNIIRYGGATSGVFLLDSYIYSLAITNDYILAGTYNGLKHFRLIGNGTIGYQEDFATNASAIMSNDYEVNTLLAVYPELNELDTPIFSSIDFSGRNQEFDHICLWAYYPNRGNWNRE